MDRRLHLHQELMLLILDDSDGTFDGSMYHYGLAGATLSELLLQGRLKVSNDDARLVNVALREPIGDELLDELLQKILESKKEYGLQHWVSTAASIKDLEHRIANQLCDLGILKIDEKKILWMFTKRVYPELDGSIENEIRTRMADVMFTPGIKADERTAAIIAFAKSCRALDSNFAKVELKQYEQRIDDICAGKILATEATDEAITAVQTAVMVATIASTIALTTAVRSN